ncbi:hypothetical protein HDU93_001023 [Gonapodya sp. JEL0774]|nr:hypothetical protein HDU93_001023 [Gonapodya sp. JEL0774]
MTFAHVLRYLRDLNLVETLQAFELEAPSLFDDYRKHHHRPPPEKPLHAILEELAEQELKERGKQITEDNLDFHPTIPTLVAAVAMDGTMFLVDVSTGEVVQSWKEHAKYAVRCGFSEDGEWLVSASYDKTIRIYKRELISGGLGVLSAAVEETEPDVVTGDSDLDALTAKLFTPHPTYKLSHVKTFRGAVEAMAFLPSTDVHPYATLVVGTRNDHYLHYIGLTSSSPPPSPEAPSEVPDVGPFPHLLFNLNSGDDTWVSFTAMDLASSPSGKHILVHTDSRAGRLLIVRARHAGPVKSLYGISVDGLGTYRCAWSPSGDYVYATGDGISTADVSVGGEVGVWEVKSEKMVACLKGHQGVVKAVAVMPRIDDEVNLKSDVVVTCSFDKSVRIWEVPS